MNGTSRKGGEMTRILGQKPKKRPYPRPPSRKALQATSRVVAARQPSEEGNGDPCRPNDPCHWFGGESRVYYGLREPVNN